MKEQNVETIFAIVLLGTPQLPFEAYFLKKTNSFHEEIKDIYLVLPLPFILTVFCEVRLKKYD